MKNPSLPGNNHIPYQGTFQADFPFGSEKHRLGGVKNTGYPFLAQGLDCASFFPGSEGTFCVFGKNIRCTHNLLMVRLGGDFKYLLFSSLLGEDSHFDDHIFQGGWFNHQLVRLG